MNDIKEEQTAQKKKFDWVRFLFWTIFLLGILILSAIAISNMTYSTAHKIRPSCIKNLRNLGIIIENYSTDLKGHYPQNLEVLVMQGYIEELPTCVETGNSYILEIDGWDSEDFTVWDPNPEKHVGTKGPKSVTASLYYYAGGGVIQVNK